VKLKFFTILWAGGKPIESTKTELSVAHDRPFLFGRGSESVACNVPIDTASRIHASLICVDDQWFLHDGFEGRRSQNGIFYGAAQKEAIGISALVSADKLSSEIFIARSNGDRLELVVEWVDRDFAKDTASFDLTQQLEQKLVIVEAEIKKLRAFGEEAIQADRLRRVDGEKLKIEIQSKITLLETQQGVSARNDRWMGISMLALCGILLLSSGGKLLSDKGRDRLEGIGLDAIGALVAGAIGAKTLMGDNKKSDR
jgi:hypothetical protein